MKKIQVLKRREPDPPPDPDIAVEKYRLAEGRKRIEALKKRIALRGRIKPT